MADDEIQEVRDNFYIANFQRALQLCETTGAANDIQQSELRATLARCCLSIPLFDRLKSFQNSDCPGQVAAALMAIIMKSKNEQQRTSAKERLATLAGQSQDLSCGMLYSISLAMDGSWNDAVEQAKAHSVPEMQALCVMFCLCCNQVSMAEQRLAEMAGKDDSAAFRLATAAVKLAAGDPEEAYFTYCDLIAQYPSGLGDADSGSVLLQTGKAVANMRRGMFPEAFEDLQRALALAPNDPDVLVNLCTCLTHLRRPADFQQHFSRLEQVCPAHPYVAKTKSIRSVFDRFKASN